MRIGAVSAAGAVMAAVLGGGYAARGQPDFSVEVHRPQTEVFAAFRSINPTDTDLQTYGFDVPHVSISRPSDHELVFAAPSANAGQITKVSFSFAPGSNESYTKVTAAIDVPPIPMSVDGSDKVLSERKVEAQLHEAIGELAKQIDNGNSTVAASNKIATFLQIVALASQPAKLQKAMARIAEEKSASDRFQTKYEREGWRFNEDGTGTREYGDDRGYDRGYDESAGARRDNSAYRDAEPDDEESESAEETD